MSSLLLAVWTIDVLLNLPQLNDPQIRPDGKSYAYVQKGKVYQAAFDSNSAKLVHDGRRPRWSPDSKLLAFTAGGQIFVYEAGTGNIRQFTHSPAAVTTFSWSPDSRAIGYLAVDPGPPPDPIVSGKYSHYSRLYWQAMDADTAKCITKEQVHVTGFALSPSGDQAVYAAQATPVNQDSLQSDLFTVDLKTLATKPLVVQPGRDGDPSYSPDGKWIAFHSQGGTINYFDKRDVALMPANGGTIRYITRGHPEDVFRGGTVFTCRRTLIR